MDSLGQVYVLVEKSGEISFLQKECGVRTISAWTEATDLVWIDATKILLRSWKTMGLLEGLSPLLAPGPIVAFVVCALVEEIKFTELRNLTCSPSVWKVIEKATFSDFSSCQAQDLSPDVEGNAVTTGAQGAADSRALPVSHTLESGGRRLPHPMGLLENILLKKNNKNKNKLCLLISVVTQKSWWLSEGFEIGSISLYCRKTLSVVRLLAKLIVFFEEGIWKALQTVQNIWMLAETGTQILPAS